MRGQRGGLSVSVSAGAWLWVGALAVAYLPRGVWAALAAPTSLVLVVAGHIGGQFLVATYRRRPVRHARIGFFGGNIEGADMWTLAGGPLAVGLIFGVCLSIGTGEAAVMLTAFSAAFAGLSILPIEPLAGGLWWSALLEWRKVRRRRTWIALLGTLIPAVCGLTALVGGGVVGAVVCGLLMLRNSREVWARRRVLFGGRWADDD